MGFYGVRVDDDDNVVSILTRDTDIHVETICINSLCGRSISPITSRKVTVTVGKAPKDIDDPNKRRDSAGNILKVRIFIPVTVKGRMCCDCVGNLNAEQYTNKHGELVTVFKNEDNHTVKVHFENAPNVTIHGNTKSDVKSSEPKEKPVTEVRLGNDDVVYVEIVEPAEPVNAEAFNKFGFRKPSDYRRFIQG